MARARYAVNFGLIAGLALSWAGSATAQDYAARSWAASCASCHGTDGRSAGAVPSIAGRSKSDLLTLLGEFKAGKRKAATIMHQYAAGYSDAELERIAEYFSRQPR
ncbi:MAG: c-type cytochrome [Betaproteobacteria bacterium]|nr:c-type cytochrome [Betaproteobacteria bacterium]